MLNWNTFQHEVVEKSLNAKSDWQSDFHDSYVVDIRNKTAKFERGLWIEIGDGKAF